MAISAFFRDIESNMLMYGGRGSKKPKKCDYVTYEWSQRGPDFVLIESAKTGDDEMVKIILENEEVDVNVEDDYGYTALCYAALKGTY